MKEAIQNRLPDHNLQLVQELLRNKQIPVLKGSIPPVILVHIKNPKFFNYGKTKQSTHDLWVRYLPRYGNNFYYLHCKPGQFSY